MTVYYRGKPVVTNNSRRKENTSMNINSLRNYTAHGSELEVLMGMSAELSLLADTYAKHQIAIPDWVGEKATEIDTEIKALVRADRQAAIKKMRSQRAALMTNEEKRGKLDAEIAELEKQL
jgi:hypothetical protein